MLTTAVQALKTLKRDDITEVKSMKSPPAGVKLTMEAVCIMMGEKANRVKDPNDMTRKIDDWWTPGKPVMTDMESGSD